MLPPSTMGGDTPPPVSYYNSRPAELGGPAPPHAHGSQPYTLYNGADTNGINHSVRPPLRSPHYLEITDPPVSPRTQHSEPNTHWPHPQRSPLDHRAALEPPIVHRDISHASSGIPSPDFRPLHSPGTFGRPPSSLHAGYVPPPAPLSREREAFDTRPYAALSDRTLHHPAALQPPIQPEQPSKSFPPPHAEYAYPQPGGTSPYSRPPGGAGSGGEFPRPFPPSFDSRIQHSNQPPYQLERRHTTPHPPSMNHPSDLRRESHTPSGSSTTMSPPQVFGRLSNGQHPHYIAASDSPSRHQNYRLHTHAHDSTHHNEHVPSALQNTMGSRQSDFLPRPHVPTSVGMESIGLLRGMNQIFNTSPSVLLPPKQVSAEGYEPPMKRVKTEEHGGSTGHSTGDVSDQDTEDGDAYGGGDRASSGTPDGKKRKYSGKNSGRPSMQRNRSTSRPNYEDMDEEVLPKYVDGVRVNKEWGLTKAGKARQRLPQACIACRKKKIKCIISKGQTICEKCKQQNMVCEFKSSTSSRSKGNSAAPETQDDFETKHEGSQINESNMHVTREDEVMTGVRGMKEESENDHAMDYIPSMEPAKPSTFLKEESIPVTRTTEAPTPMFVPDVMDTTMNGSFAESRSIPGDNTREMHVKDLAAQWQGSMPRPRQSPVGLVGTPLNHGSSPPSPVSTDIYQGGRRYYHSTRSRSIATPAAGTPSVGSVPGPFGEDPRNHLLPDPKVLEHLVTLYFTHVYSQHYPFLHRNTFMNNLERHRPVLLFSLCAIAARFSEQYRDAEEQFAVQARQLILDNFDEQKLEVVQAMVLMGLHDFGSNNGHKAWMFAGMAVRLGAAMNLNMEPRKEKGKSPVEIEVQRRTYWSYYLMDRLNSYGVARPFLTQDHDCHIQLPCDQVSFENQNQKSVITEHLRGKNPYWPLVGNEHMGAFAYLVRIASIWGDVLKYIHLSGFVTHDAKQKPPEFKPDTEFIKFVDRLKEWKGSLPPSLRYSDENLGGQIKAGTVGAFVMMHVMFHTCAAYVYRYVMTVTIPESSKEFISQHVPKEYIVSSIRKIFVHADSVMQIMEHVWERKQVAEKNGDQSVTVVAPFIGQAVSDACMIGVIRASQAPSGVDSADAQRHRVVIALSWLRELKKYWRPIESMYDKLQKACNQMGKQSNAAKSVLPKSSSSTGSVSVSPRQPLPENGFIPSPDHASQQLHQMHQDLVPYPNTNEYPYENSHGTSTIDIMQYTHLTDLVYNVPYIYYVDAFGGQGAMDALAGYAIDEGIFPNIFPDLISPATIPDRQSFLDSLDNVMDQQPQQAQQPPPLGTFGNNAMNQSPVMSHSSSTTQHHYHSHHPNASDNAATVSSMHSPVPQSVPSGTSPPSSVSSSEGEDDDDNPETELVEKEEDFGHRYFAIKDRMEILRCLNYEDVKEDVKRVVTKNILEGDDGDADGEALVGRERGIGNI